MKLIKLIIYIVLFIVLFKMCAASCDYIGNVQPDYSTDGEVGQRWCSTHDRAYTGTCSSCKARTPKVKY